MKAVYVVLLSAAAGIVLGAGTTWLNFGESPALAATATESAPSSADGKRAKVLVSERAFDFGAIERDRKVRHEFRLTNAGEAALTLEALSTTCTKCTIAELEKPRLEPGESANVVVEYTPSIGQPTFRQIAAIRTNDPENPRVELTIYGTVKASYLVLPPHLVLSKIAANETRTASVKVLAFLADAVRLQSYKLENTETAAFFDVTSEQIPSEQLSEQGAKSGCRVLVTVKPGLPLGPFQQTIRLEIALGDSAEIKVEEIPVRGVIDSDISLAGPGWDASQGRLTIGAVKSARGTSRKLFLLVRGDHRQSVQFKVATVEPSWLKVSLGEPQELSGATVTQIPVTFEIPPGTPPVNHLGSDQGKYAEVILATTHPEVQQVRLFLRFAIEP